MPTKEDSTPILVSLIINLYGLKGEQGHMYDYHRYVGNAAKLLNWEHQAAIPKNAELTENLPYWMPCLEDGNFRYETNPFKKIKSVYKLASSMARYLQEEVISKSRPSVIFIEYFSPLQLLAFAFSLLGISRKQITVWLLYRFPENQKSLKRLAYKILNLWIKNLVNQNKLILLTDSEALQKMWEEYFGDPVIVMPIPHVEKPTQLLNIDERGKFLEENRNIICWWPGSPRLEKGQDILRYIISLTSVEASLLCLVAAETSNFSPVVGGCQVKLISAELSREEYVRLFSLSDLVLLPYDPAAYRERTSGIFTESIVYGKIPVGTEGTWMAGELIKYGLGDLVIPFREWQEPKIASRLVEIATNSDIPKKVAEMSKSYTQIHGERSYANVMYDLYNSLGNVNSSKT